jgi:YebC/PmpR family DNA-binding regulatory protein
MAGHSKFKNIMYRKGAQDAKRSKLFSKLSREITVAAKLGGEDMDSNSRLRLAVKEARSQSMISRASAGDGDNYENVQYEGFGPGGVSIIVEGLTDNRNRTASEVRAAFSKNGGNMGETGSVSYQFDHVGMIQFAASVGSADDVFEAALEAGAEDIESTDETHEIYCPMEDFAAIRNALEEALGELQSAKLIWKPQNTIYVEEEQARTLFKLIDVLEDDDDVQNVFSNFEISDDVMEKLSA